MDNKNTKELNFSEFFGILKTRWLILLIVAAVCGVLAFGYSRFFVTPMYRASAQLFVDTRKEDGNEGQNTYTTATQISAAKEVASTYVHVIKNNSILNRVIKELDLDMTYNQLKSKITVEVVEDTQLLNIFVVDANKSRALRIVSKIVEIAPDMINEKIDSGNLIKINDPEVSSKPVSPDVLQNTMICFVGGFIVAYVYFFIRHLLDNKFKSAESIQRILDLPVLGVIPALDKISSK